MKKLLYVFMALFVSSAMLVACGDDDDEAITFDKTAPEAAAGEYAGTFIRVTKGKTDTVSAEGVIAISAGANAYAAHMTLKSDGLSLDKGVAVNITHANRGYQFCNPVNTNEMKAVIIGTIDESGQLSTQFTLNQTSGWSTKIYDYTFVGAK